MGIPNSIPHPHPVSGGMTLIPSYLAPYTRDRVFPGVVVVTLSL